MRGTPGCSRMVFFRRSTDVFSWLRLYSLSFGVAAVGLQPLALRPTAHNFWLERASTLTTFYEMWSDPGSPLGELKGCKSSWVSRSTGSPEDGKTISWWQDDRRRNIIILMAGTYDMANSGKCTVPLSLFFWLFLLSSFHRLFTCISDFKLFTMLVIKSSLAPVIKISVHIFSCCSWRKKKNHISEIMTLKFFFPVTVETNIDASHFARI